MISSVSSSVSALRAYDTSSAVSANNLANVETDNFKKSRTVFNENTDGGVKVTISQSEEENPVALLSDGSEKIMSNTDISEEMAQQIRDQNGYGLNAKSIQADDDMKGTVIDMMA